MGADICCDSAHKTLPVLTGGAYLQIHRKAPKSFAVNAKQAMALFGSTSPSYLTMTSLDLCNQYLENGYVEKLYETMERLQHLRESLTNAGWKIETTDPLKLTIRTPKGLTGTELAENLRLISIECEYADSEYVVLMATPENSEDDYQKLQTALGKNELGYGEQIVFGKVSGEKEMSIRRAVFAEHEIIPVSLAVGRICGSPTVSCPPAIPVVISGEVIDKEAVVILEHYGIQTIEVVKE